MSTFRRMFILLGIPVLTWVGSVGVAESVSRALGKHPADDFEGIYQPFADGSFKLRPDCASFANWFSGPFHVYTDELGLRCGPDVQPGVSSDRRIDVLILGDSQGFGQGVSYEHSVAGALKVAGASEGLTVANASVGGHFLLNQFELARWIHEEQGVKFHSILVLLTPRMIAAPEDKKVHLGPTDGRGRPTKTLRRTPEAKKRKKRD